MKITIPLTIAHTKLNFGGEFEPVVENYNAEVVCVDFKKQIVRLSYKPANSRRQVVKLPIGDFWRHFELTRVGL